MWLGRWVGAGDKRYSRLEKSPGKGTKENRVAEGLEMASP